MNIKYIDGSRSVVEHNGIVYRRFEDRPPVWQIKIHTGEFHNLQGGEGLETAYQNATVTRYRIPESRQDRLAILREGVKNGFEFIVAYGGFWELFRNEADHQARVRELVREYRTCPLNGDLRRESFHWYI